MKRQPGIRNRIMLYLALFVAFIIILLWVFQILLLDDFYSMYKRRQVERAADVLVQNLASDDLPILAEHLATTHDLCVLVVDAQQRSVVSAEGLRHCLLHRVNGRALTRWIERSEEGGGKAIEYYDTAPMMPNGFNPRRFQGAVQEMTDSRDRTMIYARGVTLADGSQGTLFINAVITPVTSTVDALRYQLGWITAIVLAAALLLALLLTRHVSRPIVETNEAARALSRSRYQPPKRARQYREIAELNDTLTQAAEDLNKVEKLQHELIANISHDLRTPLTMIGGYAEMMRDLPGESTPENMQVIMDETARLTTLVNELLDFSRLQSGSIPMSPAPFDLTEAVQTMIQRIATLTGKDGYVIRFEPEEHVTVMADETRIGQVVYNLIGNALTYAGEHKNVTVSQSLAGERVRITVRDDGKGIAEDELPLIWNRYYRTKETHKRAVVGSGLGLNIVRAILEQHHAVYGVDSKPGEGTAFWFELPLIRDAAGEVKTNE